jgi:thioredoxin 1
MEMAETHVSVHSSHHDPPGAIWAVFFVAWIQYGAAIRYDQSHVTSSFSARSFSDMSSAHPVTDATFKDEVLDSELPVLVDFWAPWCGPCRMVAPVVDEISQQYAGRIKVVKMNTDENPEVASTYGIRSIPTLMVFKGGTRVDMVVGAVPKTTLATTLERHLDA